MTTDQDIQERLETLKQAAEQLFGDYRESPQREPEKAREEAREKLKRFPWNFEDRGHETPAMLRMTKHACGKALMGNPHQLISFVGKSGTGKTHLAERIRAFWKKYLKFEQIDGNCGIPRERMFRTLKWATLQDKELDERRRQISIAREADLLIIDDMGAEHGEKMTQWAAQQILSLLESRQHQTTVITSNMPMAQIMGWDARIADRMRRPGCLLVEVTRAGSYAGN